MPSLGKKHLQGASGVVSPPRDCKQGDAERCASVNYNDAQAASSGCGCGLGLEGPSCPPGLWDPLAQSAGFSWCVLSMPLGGSGSQASPVPSLEAHERQKENPVDSSHCGSSRLQAPSSLPSLVRLSESFLSLSVEYFPEYLGVFRGEKQGKVILSCLCLELKAYLDDLDVF